MSSQIIFIVIAFVIVAFIIWIVLKRKSKTSSLFGREGIDFLPKSSSGKERASFMDDIDVIIENSKKLGEVLVTAGNRGQLYEKIMLDKELIEKIKQAKSRKEIEEILTNWAEKNSPPGENEVLRQSQRVAASVKKQQSKSGELHKIKKTNAKNKTLLEAAAKNSQIEEKVKTQQPTQEAKQLYSEIRLLLESRSYDRLIEIIKNLKAERIESLLSYYHRNFGDDKFSRMLKNSRNPQDVLVLLKMETIDGLNAELDRIKEIAAYARRKGKDVQHQTLALLSIPQKIKMFAATFDKKDFYKVRSALLKIESEVNEILAEKKLDKKEEKQENKTDSEEK